MPRYQTEDIRNIAFVGHTGCGKTSLVEALLARSGAIGEAGSVARGSTVTDHDPLEHEFEHSLDSAIASLDFEGTHVNLIDTPGFPDFRGATLAGMSAAETTAVVVNAHNGIELSTRRLMRRAKRRRLCRMIVINRIDAEGIDLAALVNDIRQEFGTECLPINLPAENYSTVRDCFFQTEGETDILSLAEAHEAIIDQVVEVNEALMEKYLEGEELSREELHNACEQALREGHLVPICFTSAQTGAGVGEFLKLCKRLVPNPAEGNPPPFLKGDGSEQVSALPDPEAHVIAHVFKIHNDPFVGKMGVFRIYQGTVRPDTQLYIGDARKPFKVGHLFKVQGGKHNEVDAGIPGDICAVAKVEEIHYDAVLHDSHDEDEYRMRAIDFPQPMYGLAVQPKTRGQEQKLSTALQRLSEEDPCFTIEQNQELNETVMRGLGELHMRVMLERMAKKYNVEVETRPPRIAYRETITRNAEGHYRHKKQTGGAGQFGEVFLRVRPLGRGEGFEFLNKVVGGAIPTSLIPAVEKGIRQIMAEGAVAGYALQDLEVTVYDGKHHPVDSKEIAFVIAARNAFLDAIRNAGPQILEPVVTVDVTVPEMVMGDITGNLAGRRARISGTESLRGGLVTIKADIPLSSLTDYHTELKSLTQGQGSFTMEFSHYDPVPHNVQEELVAAFKPRESD
ncbi:MAG: elongation factor G [Xanthomonadales bacterium]|nr:elongation factor G [Xanthomonadales bacterium]NIN58295.1 elongation factor G [Xanthomonadales bacterium]NIN73640.1 elongation factor G [Xanthomonadales bacterium]NIO14425.1 elongation factor G [Xanthomonadales bacterium]NIP10688.1 elongation factor G [Xanthomonadales bacterium]